VARRGLVCVWGDAERVKKKKGKDEKEVEILTRVLRHTEPEFFQHPVPL
jgi:hypothetical protein